MDGHCLTNEQILAFSAALFQAERSQATVEKYLRSVRAFSLFLDGRPVTKDTVLAWKKHLQREENYSPSTVNASLAALNYLFNFLGWADCRTHYLKIQRRLFRETGRELDRADYEKLIAAALGLGRERIALVMETICATGIRVGEVRYITVEAVRAGSATISLKGKIRTILLPGKLCKKLLKYARKHKTVSGEIFLTRNGTSLSRRQIWTDGGCRPDQGVSSQPAAPVCHGLLPNLQGHCKISGYSGAFQRGNHPNLSADYRHGAPAATGTFETGALNGISIPLCLSAKSNQTGPFHLIILSCSEGELKEFR